MGKYAGPDSYIANYLAALSDPEKTETGTEFGAILDAKSVTVAGLHTKIPGDAMTEAVRNAYSIAPALHYWRRAKARVRSGQGRARVLVAGSSSVNGTGTGSGSGFTDGAAPFRFSSRAAARMTDLKLPAQWNSVFGTGNLTGAGLALADTRITLGAGWAPGVAYTAGGPYFQNSTTINPLGFVFTDAFDRFELCWSRTTSNPGSFEVVVNGAVVDTISSSGAQALMRKTYTVTKGTPSVQIRKAAADTTSIYIHSVEAWDTTLPAVTICNAGWGSSDASNWADFSSPTKPANVLRTHAFDLSVLMFGINIQSTATIPTIVADVAAWSASFQTIIDYATKDASNVKTGDAILIVPQGTVNDPIIQKAFADETKRLAIVNKCAIFDLGSRFESYAKQAELGYNISTPSHVSRTAHQDIGDELAQFLIAA